jgi:hypothetical protein
MQNSKRFWNQSIALLEILLIALGALLGVETQVA